MTRDNCQKLAVNLLTSMVANAHSLALQSHAPAGLVIYDDWMNYPNTPKTYSSQSSVQLVVASSYSSSQINFIRAPRTSPQPLPRGIKVSTLDDSTNGFRTQDAIVGTDVCRIILFDGEGHMVLRNGLMKDASLPDTGSPLTSDVPAVSWNLQGGSVGVSSPGFVVFNANELQAAKDKNTVNSTGTLSTWLMQHADIMVVNAYTGNVIR
jgi:hypothetical protein